MKTYTSDKEIEDINSQANEQANASLRRLATQIAHMTPDNAMYHLKTFLAIRNTLKKLSL